MLWAHGSDGTVARGDANGHQDHVALCYEAYGCLNIRPDASCGPHVRQPYAKLYEKHEHLRPCERPQRCPTRAVRGVMHDLSPKKRRRLRASLRQNDIRPFFVPSGRSPVSYTHLTLPTIA